MLSDDLLRARMMRGALTGPAEPEKRPLRYCTGKLDNNRPCRIVVIGDELYCRRHKKEIEALEAGAPLPPGRVERQVSEESEMASKRGTCKACGRKDMMLPSAGMCGTCYNKAKAAGTYPEPANIVNEKPADEKRPTPSALTYDNENEKAVLAGAAITPEPEIPAVAVAPPVEQADPFPAPQSSLARLLRPAQPPIPSTAILLDFNEHEFAAIQDEKVTPDEIKRLVLMLIAGELATVVEVEDPLAKSRLSAE